MSALHYRTRNAIESTRRREKTRLLTLDTKTGAIGHRTVADLPSLFQRGDVLVLNDAATVPASLKGRLHRTGDEIEVRLATDLGRGPSGFGGRWRAVLFGAGDWRLPTETRLPPPPVVVGDILEFAGGHGAVVVSVRSEISKRLVEIEFATSAVDWWSSHYAAARPIQYSYLQSTLEIWDQQTIFSGPAVAVEPPSASFPLTWSVLFAAQARGAEVIALTHGTGLSSTGDAAIDRALPFPEPYRISGSAKAALLRARDERRRIIPIGTGTARALEAWGGGNSLDDGWDWANVKLTEASRLKIATGLLTGLHEPEASHIDLLKAFASAELLQAGYREAERNGYLWHEYGDLCWIS